MAHTHDAARVEPGCVQVILDGTTTRVMLSGEIDASLRPELVLAAHESADAGRPIEVDARHVTFMDSAGLHFLARLCALSADRVVLLRPSDVVRMVVEVTGMDEALDVVDEPVFRSLPDAGP